jgi:hypothetical protein
MSKRISVQCLIEAIEQLDADPPRHDSRVWYTTQKEHWLGWLDAYDGPGAYGRVSTARRDARYAYNHIVNYQMLEWLARAAGADAATMRAVQAATKTGTTLQQKSAAIRRVVPWDQMVVLLWADQQPRARRRPRRRADDDLIFLPALI